MKDRMVVVLDVGKTMAKASLWDAAGGLVRRVVRPNARCVLDEYPALDAAGIEVWFGAALKQFAGLGRIGAIIPVAHGAAAAIVRDGVLAAPPMDYEYEPSQQDREAYQRQRDAFSHTGSPAMGLALNLGQQLHCLEAIRPELLTGDALILPWPQYWAWVLSGVAASEVTSLGSHTDLWSPARNCASDMAMRRGWAARLAPLRQAHDVLGLISRDWAKRTGLPGDVQVYAGLHDSNAALYAARGFPEIADQDATVISTGTWFVSMRSLGSGSAFDLKALPDDRNCLVNVDTEGRPAPTALFMGGREIELLGGADIDSSERQNPMMAAIQAVVGQDIAVSPTWAPGTGPFPNGRGGWTRASGDASESAAAIALYAALMCDVGLDLIGASGPVLIDGRFGRCDPFTRALAGLRQDARVFVGSEESDVSFGALRVARPHLKPNIVLKEVSPLALDLSAYRSRWRDRVSAS
ncbi:MAG: carbohydrate kinase [Terricaulis sp.]